MHPTVTSNLALLKPTSLAGFQMDPDSVNIHFNSLANLRSPDLLMDIIRNQPKTDSLSKSSPVKYDSCYFIW